VAKRRLRPLLVATVVAAVAPLAIAAAARAAVAVIIVVAAARRLAARLLLPIAARRLAAVVASTVVAAARRHAAVVTALAMVVAAVVWLLKPLQLLKLPPRLLLKPLSSPERSDPQALCLTGRQLPCCCPLVSEVFAERPVLTAGSGLSYFLAGLSCHILPD